MVKYLAQAFATALVINMYGNHSCKFVDILLVKFFPYVKPVEILYPAVLRISKSTTPKLLSFKLHVSMQQEMVLYMCSEYI